ncbi:MAG TPA: hypothetical protein VG455_09605 [Acidimicrobiales bacterium]|nr:hypothetical protein [Acidimicrobiales bacterium]
MVLGVPPEAADDIIADTLSSLLFAQLVASKAKDRYGEASQWRDRFLECLGSVGWVVERKNELTFTSSRAHFALIQPVTLAWPGEALEPLGQLAKALAALNTLPPAEPICQLVQQNSSRAGSFNVLLGSTVGSPEGLVHFVEVFRNSDSDVGDLLGGCIPEVANPVRCLAVSMRLNEAIYSGVRAEIVTKLGPRVVEDIRPLKVVARDAFANRESVGHKGEVREGMPARRLRNVTVTIHVHGLPPNQVLFGPDGEYDHNPAIGVTHVSVFTPYHKGYGGPSANFVYRIEGYDPLGGQDVQLDGMWFNGYSPLNEAARFAQ